MLVLKKIGEASSIKELKEKTNESVILGAAIGETQDIYFIPFTVDGKQVANRQDIRYHQYHNGNSIKKVACSKGVTDIDAKTGAVITSGDCPLCRRANDAYSIYNLRVSTEIDESKCPSPAGTQEHTEWVRQQKSSIKSTLKVDTKQEVFELVAKFMPTGVGAYDMTTYDLDGTQVSMPKFELKLLRVSKFKAEKIIPACVNLSYPDEVGLECKISYPGKQGSTNAKDKMQAALNASYTMIEESSNASIFKKFPRLKEVIQREAEKFDWNVVAKDIPEFNTVPDMIAIKDTDKLFECWDEYQRRLESGDKSAKYLEYSTEDTVRAFNSNKLDVVDGNAVDVDNNLAIEMNAPEMLNVEDIPDIPDINLDGGSVDIQL